MSPRSARYALVLVVPCSNSAASVVVLSTRDYPLIIPPWSRVRLKRHCMDERSLSEFKAYVV